MNRVVPWLALAVAAAALVVALRPRPVAAAEAPAPADPRPVAGEPAAPTPPVAAGDHVPDCAAAIAARERQIVDRIWPRIARIRKDMRLTEREKPATLDAALLLLLTDSRTEAEEADTRPPEERRKAMHCLNGMKQLGVYVALFESKFRDYPATWDDMKRPDMMTDMSLLKCPLDTSSDATSYEYLYPVKGDAAAPDSIVGYCRHPHPDGTRCVLYFTGRVMQVADAEFQTQLALQTADDRASLTEQLMQARTTAADTQLKEEVREAAARRARTLETIRR